MPAARCVHGGAAGPFETPSENSETLLDAVASCSKVGRMAGRGHLPGRRESGWACAICWVPRSKVTRALHGLWLLFCAQP